MIILERSTMIRSKINGADRTDLDFRADREPKTGSYDSLVRGGHKIFLKTEVCRWKWKLQSESVVPTGVGKSSLQCEAKREKNQDKNIALLGKLSEFETISVCVCT